MLEDDLTPEQAAAFERLNSAITEYHATFHDEGLLMDWILVTHLTDPLADGSDSHSTSYVGSNGQPQFRSLGLLEHASTIIRAQIGNSVF